MIPVGPSPRNTWRLSDVAADLTRPELSPHRIEVAARPKRVAFDLARTAMIVIDMQNDFCHRDGWLASVGVDMESARAPTGPLAALLPVFGRADVPVVSVNWGAGRPG